MYIIVGLGNPGKKYENTRHNAGYMVIDKLSETFGIKVGKKKFNSLIGEGNIFGEKVILVKPETYMNLSGNAVIQIVNFYKVPLENVIVVYDDLDLDLGMIRIRKSGSAGTHNGMRSVVSSLNSKEFPRVRVGIGDPNKEDIIDFVIGNISKKEKEILNDTVSMVSLAIEDIIKYHIDLAMTKYNQKKKHKE